MGLAIIGDNLTKWQKCMKCNKHFKETIHEWVDRCIGPDNWIGDQHIDKLSICESCKISDNSKDIIYKTWLYMRCRIDMVKKGDEILYKVFAPDGEKYNYTRLFEDAKKMARMFSIVGVADTSKRDGFVHPDKYFY